MLSQALYADTTAEDAAPAAVLTLDSVTYPIPDYWGGKEIDSIDMAEPETLVKLPDDLTFEDYDIYVLPETRDAFVDMAEAARRDSVYLIVDSGFRSKAFQTRIIRTRLARGDSIADILMSVAPPGYSEHHTGRALDLCPSEARFAFTDTYAWLQQNAARFGFAETLPKSDESGVHWEAWHWYFVGK